LFTLDFIEKTKIEKKRAGMANLKNKRGQKLKVHSNYSNSAATSD